MCIVIALIIIALQMFYIQGIKSESQGVYAAYERSCKYLKEPRNRLQMFK